MCGICGIIHFDNQPVQESSIRKMMKIMKYRGPDDEGVFLKDNIGFGFVRLSIIDLSPAGHQPMFSKDNRYVIVFNGEIYNYLELRDELRELGHLFNTETDTEVLITAYLEWGEDCLHRFNGMWAFAIYDRQNKTIFAARDRFGIKPLYYLSAKDYFAFASEISPLLSLLPSKPTPNYQSIFDYLAFNRTDQTEDTFFSEVKKLQHGYKFIIQTILPNGHFPIGLKWYNLRENVSKATPFSDPEAFKQLFTSSIGLRLRSDVPVGVCLSGGLDSSSIVSVLFQDFRKKNLNTFSAVYNKGQIGDESEYINEFRPLIKNMFFISPDAKSLKQDLIHFIKAHGEPIPSTGPYAQYKVMELAKGKVVVILDGQGADEGLAGYHYFFGIYFKELLYRFKIGRLFKEVFYYIIKHRSLLGIRSFLFFMLPKRLKTKARVSEKGYLSKQLVDKYGKTNSITGNLYNSRTLTDALFDHFEYKLEHLLKWEDRNSMWFSLEARVPFLDYRLVERLLACPGNTSIRNGMTKYILREGMKGILPEKIRQRKDKTGFDTPEDEWFRTPEWQIIVDDVLCSNTFKSRDLINPDNAKSLYKDHLEGKKNISREIWKWIHLELWFRQYID